MKLNLVLYWFTYRSSPDSSIRWNYWPLAKPQRAITKWVLRSVITTWRNISSTRKNLSTRKKTSTKITTVTLKNNPTAKFLILTAVKSTNFQAKKSTTKTKITTMKAIPKTKPNKSPKPTSPCSRWILATSHSD